MKTNYRVDVVSAAGPVYQVTLPSGKTIYAETKWGVRRIIRKDKYAQKMTERYK